MEIRFKIVIALLRQIPINWYFRLTSKVIGATEKGERKKVTTTTNRSIYCTHSINTIDYRSIIIHGK